MTQTVSPDKTLAVLRDLVRALDSKKAEALSVLKVSAQSSITDYLVLANGNSDPHLRALRIETEKVLDGMGMKIAGMESGGYGSGWTVIDAYQIMVHVFTTERREQYALDLLWKDAQAISIEKLLSPESKPKAAAKKKPASKKPAPAAVKKTAPKKAAVKKVAKAPAKKAAKKTVRKKTD